MDAKNYLKANSNFPRREKNIDVLEAAMKCWSAKEEFRKQRIRNKAYTFGRQWGDIILVDGVRMTEEEYIWREGNVPLKNNLIRRLVRNVVGVFRQQLAEDMESWEKSDLERARLNNMQELYARTMEEFLISGMAIHRKWAGSRFGTSTVWTDMVSPDAFFFDPRARDPRGSDVSLLGQIHELTKSEFCKAFATSEADYHRCLRDARDGKIKVTEIWRREYRQRRLCHDRDRARIIKADDTLWRSNRQLHALPSKWMAEEVWRFYYMLPDGSVIRQGDSPLAGGAHPFVFKAYPFLDGEIHSFVADIIDQQRYTNRLITLHDWIMRASAKGALLFPEDALPSGVNIDDVAAQWSRFNGVIVFTPKPGQPLPQQVSSNATNIGITDLLSIQLKMMEDVSGVNGALQGKIDSATMSGNLYSQQTRNSLTSLCDILDSFTSFISAALAKERLMAAGSV